MTEETVPRSRSRGGRVYRGAAALGFGVVLATLLSVQTADPLNFAVNLQVALAMTLLSLLGLATMAARGHRIALSPGLMIILTGFGLSTVVSLGMSAHPLVSSVRLVLYLGLVLAGILLYVGHRRQRALSLTWWCLIVAVVPVPFAVGALVALMRWGEPTAPHLGVFWNVRHLGTAGMLAAGAAVGLVALDHRHRIVAATLATLGLVDIVGTGSRGAFLAWCGTVAIVMVLTRPRRAVAVVSGTAVAASVVVVTVLDRRGLLVTPTLLDRFDKGWGEDLDTMSSGRLDVWSSSAGEVAQHPLFGTGPDAYLLSGCCVETTPHAHNLFLQALMEFGLIGCGLLLLGAGWAMVPVGPKALVRALAATRENAVLVAMIGGIVALSMIDGAFYWTFPLVHLAAFTGLLAAGVSQARRGSHGGDPVRGHSSRPSENAASRSWEE